MEIPSPITSWLATLIYALMMYILFEGVRRYILVHKQKVKGRFRNLIYLVQSLLFWGLLGIYGQLQKHLMQLK